MYIYPYCKSLNSSKAFRKIPFSTLKCTVHCTTVQLQTRNGGAVCHFFLKLTTRTLQSSADSFYMIKLYTFYHLSCFELNIECDFVLRANNILFINPFRFSKHGFNSKRMIGRCASAACTCISASNLTRLLSSYS